MMQCIWVSQIDFKPAGPLTFRRVPSGLLHIMSYPFMPPTTMSGFLRRLLDIAAGWEWPGYGDHWYNGPTGKEFTWTLDHRYRALGAFPAFHRWRMHKTRRHGPKDTRHHQFSQLLRSPSSKGNYQLHHWDYLFCDGLSGWVAARSAQELSEFAVIENFGGKAGKEGYLWVTTFHPPKRLPLRHGKFEPLGLVTPPSRPNTGVLYPLYGHHWNKDYLWNNGDKGGVDGYYSLIAWWGAKNENGYYWEFAPGVGFAAYAIDAFLQGDVQPLCPELSQTAATGDLT